MVNCLKEDKNHTISLAGEKKSHLNIASTFNPQSTHIKKLIEFNSL